MSDYFFKLPAKGKTELFKEMMIKYCLDETKSINDKTLTSIEYICYRCNRSTSNRNKPTSFLSYIRQEIISMIANGELVQTYGENITACRISSIVGFEIKPKFYAYAKNGFCKLTDEVFEKITHIDFKCSTANAFRIYAYIRSGICANPDTSYGFYKSINNIYQDLGFTNRHIVDDALNKFVDYGLFQKETPVIKGLSYVPNIYVLPDENAESNIKGITKILKENIGGLTCENNKN